MSIEEKRRGAFEAAFVKRFGFGRLTAIGNADAYAIRCAAEWAWNAALDSVVIELPKPEMSYGCMGEGMGDPWETYDAESVIEAIESAGLKVKS